MSETKMLRWDEDCKGCWTCMWRREEDNSCVLRHKLGKSKMCLPQQKMSYYANKDQVEGMFEWYEWKANEKAKAEAKEKEIPEFQVGDEVSIIQSYRGDIVHIHDEKHSNTPITVKLKDGHVRHLNLKGKLKGQGRILYHGHNPEVIVKETLPVRPKKTREAWIVVFKHSPAGNIYSEVCDTEAAAIKFLSVIAVPLLSPMKIEVEE